MQMRGWKIFFLATIISTLSAAAFPFVTSAWTGPTGSPPSNNVSAPINVGSAGQVKSGDFGILGNLGVGTASPGAKIDLTGGNLIVRNTWGSSDTVEINGNQIWNTGSTNGLYLQWSNPGGPVIVGGQGGATNNLSVYGNGWFRNGVNVSGSVGSQFGATPNINANYDNHTGGGIEVSDDGGFYDYNDGWITYNGSTGLNIAGNNGSGSSGTLTVQGNLCLGGSCITSWSQAGGGSPSWSSITGKPYPVNGQTWNWSGQGGQPAWLWGSNDGTNMYVWNPSAFSVNYANSAGSVPWSGVSGKPSNIMPYDTWFGSTYYASNGNVYLSWVGDWLSNRLNQAVTTNSAPQFSRIYDDNSGYYIDSNVTSRMNSILLDGPLSFTSGANVDSNGSLHTVQGAVFQYNGDVYMPWAGVWLSTAFGQRAKNNGGQFWAYYSGDENSGGVYCPGGSFMVGLQWNGTNGPAALCQWM